MVQLLGQPIGARSPRRPPMAAGTPVKDAMKSAHAERFSASDKENGSPGFALFSNMNVDLPASTQLKQVEELEKEVEDMGGYDVFIDAAEHGETRKVMAYIRRGADVNRPDKYGWTALIAAAAEGQTETIKALLVNPDINVNVTNKNNETALMRAVLAGHTDAATALLAVHRQAIERAGAPLPISPAPEASEPASQRAASAQRRQR